MKAGAMAARALGICMLSCMAEALSIVRAAPEDRHHTIHQANKLICQITWSSETVTRGIGVLHSRLLNPMTMGKEDNQIKPPSKSCFPYQS